MRLPPWTIAAITSLFARHTLATFSINLSELQPISGFSDACTQAYNTPLTDCTLSDFYQGNTCSPGCVAFLEDMTNRLNDECRGITAFPNTLIGMFFKKTAVQELCAGTDGSTGSGDGQDTKGSATVESMSATSSRSSTSTTSTVIETATLTATSTSLSTAPSSTLSTQTSFIPSNTASAGQASGDGSPTVTAGGSSTTSPSDPQGNPSSSDPNNGSGGGGTNDGNGGTVLEAAEAPQSTGSIKAMHALSMITACLAFAIFLS